MREKGGYHNSIMHPQVCFCSFHTPDFIRHSRQFIRGAAHVKDSSQLELNTFRSFIHSLKYHHNMHWCIVHSMVRILPRTRSPTYEYAIIYMNNVRSYIVQITHSTHSFLINATEFWCSFINNF